MSFWTWLKKNGLPIISIAGLGSIGTVISAARSIWGVLKDAKVFEYPYMWIYSLQVVLAFASLYWVLADPAWVSTSEFPDSDRPRVEDLLGRFLLWWRILTSVWVVTYAIYITQEILAIFHLALPLLSYSFVILVKGEIIASLGCYLALSQRRTEGNREKRIWIVVAIFLFLFTLAEIIVKAITLPGDLQGTAMSIASQSILCVSIAMFAGRLDSQRLPISSGITALLYAYALIQPMLQLGPNGATLFLFAASLILKGTFVLYVSFLIDTGLLQRYIGVSMRVPVLT